jgi:hypothetical protein
MSFYTSLTGLNAATAQLGVTSNNIANVGTTGFKRSRVDFGDIFATSPLQRAASVIGQGVAIKSVTQEFTQGNLQFSANSLNMGISGDGFFVMKSADGLQDVYTRSGEFVLNEDYAVVNSSKQTLIAASSPPCTRVRFTAPLNGWRWTTKIVDDVYNVYPIYDWLTEDIWRFHAMYPDKPHNAIYDKMQMAGVPLSQQRLCQPFGDDQKRGLWLYQIIEPETWAKLVTRVNGVNSGALYIEETGNMTGYNKISKPAGHTWQSFSNLLLRTMPAKTREHYVVRIKKFIVGWGRRGYPVLPDEAPPELEAKQWAPSWRRICKTLLRNDYWCKGLGFTQPKSEAYEKYKIIAKERKALPPPVPSPRPVAAATSCGWTISPRPNAPR